MTYSLKDSGTRESFDTGAVRDTREGKGRFDLISPVALRRLALLMERGATKYGDRNWEKGMPICRYIDSAIRHLVDYLEGKRDEDHPAAAAFNVFAIMHVEEMVARGELPGELDDAPDFGSPDDGMEPLGGTLDSYDRDFLRAIGAPVPPPESPRTRGRLDPTCPPSRIGSPTVDVANKDDQRGSTGTMPCNGCEDLSCDGCAASPADKVAQDAIRQSVEMQYAQLLPQFRRYSGDDAALRVHQVTESGSAEVEWPGGHRELIPLHQLKKCDGEVVG